jgi:hypothetical protein
MKTPIKKIVLDLGGKEIELTLEQAKTLFGALEELVGPKATFSPIYIERPNRWWWIYPQPTYDPVTITTTSPSFPSGTITMNNSASAYNPTSAEMRGSTLRLTC